MQRYLLLLLSAIFILAFILRFLYFPNNIYFGYDQARDAFAAEEILHGHLKLIGPPTTFEGLRHGVLYYYLYAPLFALGNGNPAVLAIFLRILNALGIFLIFMLARILFNKYVGLIAAFLFAVSFEQTQFALYLNHPGFAVISILVLFLGLSILIFKRKGVGLLIALLGLGLSIQFEFLLTYLIVTFSLFLLVFRKYLQVLSPKTIVWGLGLFILTVSSFIVVEIKYNFRTIFFLQKLIFNGPAKSLYKIITTYLFEMGQVIKFNLVADNSLILIVGTVLFMLFILLVILSAKRQQLIFLGLWFFSGLIIYFISGGEDLHTEVIQYHPNVGLSIALIIFVSYLIYLIGQRIHLFWLIVFLISIFWGNFSLIQSINPFGSMPAINAQSFMLLSDEKKVLDYIYLDSSGQPFAVKAVTLPFYVNTTWSYLFEWYGRQKYGYLPVWGGENALGYPGNLKVVDAQDQLPETRYLIIEPTRGIPQHLINEYIKTENYFTDVKTTKEIGKFQVQMRIKK